MTRRLRASAQPACPRIFTKRVCGNALQRHLSDAPRRATQVSPSARQYRCGASPQSADRGYPPSRASDGPLRRFACAHLPLGANPGLGAGLTYAGERPRRRIDSLDRDRRFEDRRDLHRSVVRPSGRGSEASRAVEPGDPVESRPRRTRVPTPTNPCGDSAQTSRGTDPVNMTRSGRTAPRVCASVPASCSRSC